MSETFPIKIIARIHTDFPTKFGVPRQSGLIDSLESLIIFEPEYRDPLALPAKCHRAVLGAAFGD